MNDLSTKHSKKSKNFNLFCTINLISLLLEQTLANLLFFNLSGEEPPPKRTNPLINESRCELCTALIYRLLSQILAQARCQCIIWQHCIVCKIKKKLHKKYWANRRSNEFVTSYNSTIKIQNKDKESKLKLSLRGPEQKPKLVGTVHIQYQNDPWSK